LHSSIEQWGVHFAKNSVALLSDAVQIRFTAVLSQCSYTYGDLLFIQVCSDPTPVQPYLSMVP